MSRTAVAPVRSGRRVMGEGFRRVLLLAPMLAVLGGLVIGGLGLAVAGSLNLGALPAQGAPGIGAYLRVLGDPAFLSGFLLSFHIALASTAISAAIALWAALLLRQRFPGRGALAVLFQMGLTVPHVVGAVGFLYLFSQSGLIARLAHAAGLIDAPAAFPALVHDPFAVGIILHYVWKEVPFIALILLAQMQALGEDHEAVARALGATRRQAVRHVLLPQLLPGLTAASVIVFAFTFGAYEIPALLGASHPQALPVLAWRAFSDVDLAARAEAMAMAVVIAVLSAGLIWAYARALQAGVGR